MTAVVMDGRWLSEEIKDYIKFQVESLKDKGVNPSLSTILVGENEASKLYIKLKHDACREVGLKSKDYRLNSSSEEEEVINLIEDLNRDEETYGILVQLPLPDGIDSYRVVESIKPEKDVDGLTPYNMGRLAYKRYDLVPCTPRGIMALIMYYDISLEGKHAVIVNRSPLVGKPLMLLTKFDPRQMHLSNVDMLLLNEDAVVSICHSKTRNLRHFTRDADILVTAVGRRPEFTLTKDMVKPGATVIDVGVTKIRGKVYGDADFNNVKEVASYITPNPGGVGPMTIAMLLYNTLIATAMQTGVKFDEKIEDYIMKIRSGRKSSLQ